MSLGVGEEFAGYTIVRRLGSGGMGEVYLAQHPRLPRQDALKLLSTSISTDPTFRKRFLLEADLAARLWHPHIVGVHDRGEDEGRLWIAMDFVDGQDAADLVSRRYPAGMPQELVAVIVTAIASALDYAHSQGLLHRDIKPANIMITNIDEEERRRILLTDFGIARRLDEVTGLTQTNMTLGTVAYAAPEQLMAEHIDGRADQYALAATAHHLLTGSPPFPYTNPAAVISCHLNIQPPRVSDTRPELAALDPVLIRALAKNPDDRFPRCADLARALAERATLDAGVAATQAAPIKPPMVDNAYPSDSRTPPPVAGLPGGKAAGTVLGARPAALLLGLAIVLGALTLGALALLWNRGSGSSATTASSAESRASNAALPPSTVTVSAVPPPTITNTVYPSATAISPTSRPGPSKPTETTLTAVIVGTCDEGGSCGVQQRAAPYNSAPKLYPNLLQDGSTVEVKCRTTGDVRSSTGYGSSRMWYQLGNGSYINSIYTNLPATGIPSC